MFPSTILQKKNTVVLIINIVTVTRFKYLTLEFITNFTHFYSLIHFAQHTKLFFSQTLQV